MRRYLAPHVYYNSGYGYLESSWGYLESLPGVIFALRNGAVSKSKWRTMVRITGSSQVVIWFRPGFAFSSHVTLGASVYSLNQSLPICTVSMKSIICRVSNRFNFLDLKTKPDQAYPEPVMVVPLILFQHSSLRIDKGTYLRGSSYLMSTRYLTGW